MSDGKLAVHDSTGATQYLDNEVVTTGAGSGLLRQRSVLPETDALLTSIETALTTGPVPVSVASLPVPTGAALDGTDGAAPPSIPGTGIRGWLRSIYDALKATIATSRTWTLGSGTDSVTTVPSGTQAVSAAALPLPAGASTAAIQTTGNASLSSIDGKTPALGQALAASSVPIVLTAAQVTTLTPPAAITNFANETGGHLAAIDTNTGATTDAAATAGGTGSIAAKIRLMTSQLNSLLTGIALAASGAKIGIVTTDQTTHGTSDLVAADITKIAGNAISQGHGTAATAIRVELPTDGTGQVIALHADTAPATQAITAADAVSVTAVGQNSQSIITGAPTAGSAATFALSSIDTVQIQITGTWVGTLVSEISMDGGTTWYTRGVHLSGTTYSAAIFTANAGGHLNVGACTHVRVRCTAFTSGTATVRVSESINLSSVYVANSLQLSDGTIPSQKLGIDTLGRVTAILANGTAVIGKASIDQTTPGVTNLVAVNPARQSLFGTEVQFDLTGLATLANGVGWLTNKITLVASNLAADKILVHYKLTAGTVTVGNTIEFYLVRQDTGANQTDGAVSLTAAGQLTSTGGVLPTNETASLLRDQLQLVGIQVMSVTTSGTVYTGSFVINDPGAVFALYIYNNSGAALTAADLRYSPITDKYQ